MSFCSPIATNDNDGENIENSCLSEEIVHKIATELKIDETKPTAKKLEEIKEKITTIANPECKGELCLITPQISLSPTLRREIKKRFRPEMPRDWVNKPNKWLNTSDIENIMNQYADAYPEMNFLAVSPIDFDTKVAIFKGSSKKECVDENICRLNIAEELLYDPPTTYIASIFNLDRHNESGSHWTGMFADLHVGESYYYDSVANYFPEEVQTLMERITTQCDDVIKNGKLSLSNLPARFTFLSVLNKTSELVVNIEQIIDYLLLNNYYTLYRYGHVYEYQFGYRVKDDVTKQKFNISDEYEGRILKHILDKIDNSKHTNYAHIPQLERLLPDTNSDQMVLTDFARTWIYTQTDIAINNFIDSLRLLKRTDTDEYIDISSISNIQADGNIYIQFKKKTDIPAGTTLVDCSFKMFKNFIQHQFKNTECGMYSIHFIANLLTTDKTFEQIVEHVIMDDEMNEMRKTDYFRPPAKA